MNRPRPVLCLALVLGITCTVLQVHQAAQQKSEPDTAKEQSALEKAAAGGDAEAQYKLGQQALRLGPDRFKHAEVWLLRAARQGHADAQLALAERYWFNPFARQHLKAVRWFRAAAEQGKTEAWLALGACYANGGDGIFQDREKALECYRRAEEQGSSEVFYRLAGVYWTGQGAIAADWSKAYSHYLKAADKGHLEAHHFVALCHDHGIGTPVDAAKAFRWYSKAAEKGHGPSIERLVACYEGGIGVAKDSDKAKAWDAKLDDAAKHQRSIRDFFRKTTRRRTTEPVAEATPKEEDEAKFTKDVEVILKTEKAAYETDELITVEITYHNKGQSTYSWTKIALENSGPRFTVRDAKGRTLPYPFTGRRPEGSFMHGRTTTTVLSPGAKVTTHALLNRSVHIDVPGVYEVSLPTYLHEGADGSRNNGQQYKRCTGLPLTITVRQGDRTKRAEAIASLVKAYRQNDFLPDAFKQHATYGRNDSLRLLMLYRDPVLIPLFLDVLENARGSSEDGSHFARIGLDAMLDNEAVAKAMEDRLQRPDRYNAPTLLQTYLEFSRPEEEAYTGHDWGRWKWEQEITRKYRGKALQLLREDKEYRYAKLVPGLLTGADDAFLVDYLLRCKSDFNMVNAAYTLERVKVGREHLPLLESMLPKRAGYHHLADAVIIQLVSMDRERYLRELTRDPERFSPEVRKMLEEDIEAEEERLVGRLPLGTDKNLRGEPLPPSAIAQLGTMDLRVQAPVAEIAFAPDSKTFATAEHDGALRIWDAATGKQLRHLGGHRRGLFAMQLSPDGQNLIAAGEGGVIHIIDLVKRPKRPDTDQSLVQFSSADDTPSKQLNASASSIHDLAVSSDGKLLVSSSADTSVHLWDLTTGKLKQQLRPPVKEDMAARRRGESRRRDAVAFGPDGRTVAVGTRGQGVALVDVPTGKEQTALGGGKLLNVTALVFATAGKSMFTGSSDGEIRCWETDTGREVRSFTTATKAPVLACALSRDGRWLAAAYEGESDLVLWEVSTAKEARRFTLPRGVPYTVAFSPDGKCLAAAGDGPIIGLWHVASRQECCPAASNQASINAVAFARDNRTLASGSDGGTIQLWDVGTGKATQIVARAPEAITQVCFTPGNQSLLTFGTALRRWDLSTGKQQGEVRGPEDAVVVGGRISGDGTRVAIAYANQEVRVLDARTGRERLLVKGASPVLALGEDGRILALADPEPEGKIRILKGDAPGNIRWLDVDTGKQLGEGRVAYQNGSAARIPALLVSPSGRSVMTAIQAEKIFVWETTTASARPTSKHDHGFGFLTELALAVSPNGAILAVAEDSIWNDTGAGKYGVRSGGGSIALWDLTTGRLFHKLQGHKHVTALAFSPDGALLASVGRDTTALVWDLRDFMPRRTSDVALTPKELDEVWNELGNPDAASAYAAMSKLALAPRQATALFRKHLKAAAPRTAAPLARLLADLDSDVFAVRENAMQELRVLGELAVPALRQRLAEKPTVELKRRIDALLHAHDQRLTSPPLLRQARAVEVLEWIASAEAKQFLAVLAGGTPGAMLTADARAVLERLGAR